VEMGVEGRGFEHLGKRQLHFVGERGQVRGGDLAIAVLDQMQVLDQEVATPRPVAEQCGDLLGGLGIDLASLGGGLGPSATLARMLERTNLLHIMTHRDVSFSSFSFKSIYDSMVWHARCQGVLSLKSVLPNSAPAAMSRDRRCGDIWLPAGSGPSR